MNPVLDTESMPTVGSARSRWIVLALLCIAQFTLIVDVVVVNVALPSMRAELVIPDSRLPLIAVAYTLTFGSLLIVAGRAGDLVGRRRLFLTGLGVFTVASLTTGMAQSEYQVLVSRVGQGIGAALVSATALALLATTFVEGPERNRALGVWGAVGSAGAIAGQLIGGFLTDVYGWRSIFLINVPIGIVALVAASHYLTESRTQDRPRLDVAGSVLLTGAMATAMLALTVFAEGKRPGLGAMLAAGAVAAGATLAVVERRAAQPVIDSKLLGTGQLAKATVLLAVNAGVVSAALLFTTVYMQVTLGYTPLEVGTAFAPITLLIMLVSPKAGVLTTRYGPRRMLAVGFTLIGIGTALLSRLPQDGTYFVDVLPALLLMGIGAGLAYAPTFIAGTAEIPDQIQGFASGFLNAGQEVGAAVGVTVLGAIASFVTVAGDQQTLTGGYRAGLVTATLAIFFSLAVIARLSPRTTD